MEKSPTALSLSPWLSSSLLPFSPVYVSACIAKAKQKPFIDSFFVLAHRLRRGNRRQNHNGAKNAAAIHHSKHNTGQYVLQVTPLIERNN